MVYQVTIAGKTHRVELARSGTNWVCKINGHTLKVDVIAVQNGILSLLVQGKSYEVKQENTTAEVSIVIGSERFTAVVRDPRSLRSRNRADGVGGGPRKISAPMPGKVVRVLGRTGDPVEAGQGVVIIEAMKMQNELKSPKKGKIRKLNVTEGALVEAGEVLAEVE